MSDPDFCQIFENRSEISEVITQSRKLLSKTLELSLFLDYDRRLPGISIRRLNDQAKQAIYPQQLSTEVKRVILESDPPKSMSSSYMIYLDSLSLPNRTNATLPSLTDIRQRMSTDSWPISILSTTGYNFIQEFQNVYRGHSTSENVFSNVITIIQRALQAVDCTLDDEIALEYANHIIRVAARDSALARDILPTTVKTSFPLLKGAVRVDTRQVPVQIFIGRDKDGGEVCFYVRILGSIQTVRNNQSPVVPPPPPLTPNSIVVAVRTYVKFTRRYSLRDDREGDRDRDIDIDIYNDMDIYEDPVEGEDVDTGNIVKSNVDITGKFKIRRINRINEELVILFTEDEQSSNAGSESVTDLQGTEAGRGEAESKEPSSSLLLIVQSRSAGTSLEASGSDSDKAGSLCSELFGWGRNPSDVLGMTGSMSVHDNNKSVSSIATVTEPCPVSVPASLALERVRQIACGAAHTLLLTWIGSIYACGDNAEGALGLGDLTSRQSFSPLPWSLEHSSRVDLISTGSCRAGAHSMALDKDGSLFCWGSAALVGLGGLRAPTTTPTRLQMPVVPGWTSRNNSASNSDSDGDSPFVSHVSCGGGFTVAVLFGGHLVSWGMWHHGRLGLGDPPKLPSRNNLLRKQERTPRYQLRPKLLAPLRYSNDNNNKNNNDIAVTASQPVVVSCGGAHALCLCSDGSVWSWGENVFGQLGHGLTRSGSLRDSFSPVEVFPFLSTTSVSLSSEQSLHEQYPQSRGGGGGSGGDPKVMLQRATLVHSGPQHSLAVGMDGRVWSWGAMGHHCLGHCDGALQGPWANKITSVFQSQSTSTASAITVPYELLGWAWTWSVPRPVLALAGTEIEQIVAGIGSSAFVGKQGRLFLCGDWPVVPPFPLYQETTTADTATETQTVELKDEKVKHVFVSAPRSPSGRWLSGLSSRKVVLFAAAGAVDMKEQVAVAHVFALLDQEHISVTLTSKLLRRAEKALSHETDDSSVVSELSTGSESRLGPSTLRRGGIDCSVIAGGRQFLGHRSILSQRCPVIRDMLLAEDPAGEHPGTVTQLLLPELRYDTAKYLVHFLYTDQLLPEVAEDISLLRALVEAAKSLRLPRLQLICQRLLHVRHILMEEPSLVPSDGGELGLELPQATLARDLGSLLGDPQFADVRFVSLEGRGISVHRAILEGRCEYFRAMFRFRHPQGVSSHFDGDGGGGVGDMDIVVPDTFLGLLRLLLFLYSDTLPGGSDATLVQDLLAADRYGVPDMRLLCESLIAPSSSNWHILLEVANQLSCMRLLVEVEAFLRDNPRILMEPAPAPMAEADEGEENEDKDPDVIDELSGLQWLRAEFPDVVVSLLDQRQRLHPAPPSHLLTSRVLTNTRTEDAKATAVPWRSIVMVLVAACAYQIFLRVVSFGPLVPVINLGGLIALVYYFFLRM
eukprot:gene5173-10344_t